MQYITLQQVKDTFGIAGTTKDALITKIIEEFSRHLFNRGIEVGSNEYIEYHNGNKNITLSHFPVQSVTSVEVRGSQNLDEDFQLVGGGDYTVEQSNGHIIFSTAPFHGEQNVRVSYTAGHTTVPPEVYHTMIRMFARMQKKAQADGITVAKLANGLSRSDIAHIIDKNDDRELLRFVRHN